MPQTPVLDWTCSQCGASEIYELVPSPLSDHKVAPSRSERSLPTLDWSCAHCGASQTYELVPMANVGR